MNKVIANVLFISETSTSVCAVARLRLKLAQRGLRGFCSAQVCPGPQKNFPNFFESKRNGKVLKSLPDQDVPASPPMFRYAHVLLIIDIFLDYIR